MAKRPNESVGLIDCPMCGAAADVRRCHGGRRTMYWVCRCGKIEPATEEGQGYIMEHAEIFGAPEPTPAPNVTAQTMRNNPPPSPSIREPATPARHPGIVDDDDWFA